MSADQSRRSEPDEQPRLILSANAVSDDPQRVADYSCQWCEKPAVDYLFFGPQFCDDHRPHGVPK